MKSIPLVRLVLLVAGPVVLFLIPLNALQSAPDLCLFKILFHVECPGCGMTRALHCFLRGDFVTAAQFNWRVFIVVPILAHATLKSIVRDVKTVFGFEFSVLADRRIARG
jgi:hypothetical protein